MLYNTLYHSRLIPSHVVSDFNLLLLLSIRVYKSVSLYMSTILWRIYPVSADTSQTISFSSFFYVIVEYNDFRGIALMFF